MKFGGVDPSIIRELSGIYKPFPKAFKELVSNAFDADANRVDIHFDQAARRLSIKDNGIGMTPFEFRRDFTKIGGSDKVRSGQTTPSGRLRIGCKGIGFLAVARYCSRMIVETHGPRVHRERLLLKPGRAPIQLSERLDVELPKAQLAKRLRLVKVQAPSGVRARLGKELIFDAKDVSLSFESKFARSTTKTLEVTVEIDCSGLGIKATLDFEKLLTLAHGSDLYELDTFCDLTSGASADKAGYTRVYLEDLHSDVIEDLTREQRGGNAKSIEMRSGREQFQWHLARTVPLKYLQSPWAEKGGLLKAESEKKLHFLPVINLHWNQDPPVALNRQVFGSSEAALEGSAYSIIPVDIQEPGLKVAGYLLATSEVISPPEFRGITVRVRNVALGDPHFFGLERTMTGAQRAALQQITGEVVILEGLNSPDALNPGRESFYEENPTAKHLKELMAGKPGIPGGLIKRAIRKVLEHSEISSRARTYLALGARRRQALLSVASAINHFSYDGYKGLLTEFFSAQVGSKCLLKDVPTVPLRPPTRLHDYSIQEKESLKEEFAIDQDSKHIYFNYEQEVWDQRLNIAGKDFRVEAKRGTPQHPLCEFDVANQAIYVNWAHPLKQNADEGHYLKQAILWTLAFESSPKPKQVLELGLALLTHQEN